jgi:hypothetical protein
MDEAGRYATPQIEPLLTYKRKTGLRLMLAHHYFGQFDNKKVLNAIKQGARIKIMFNTPSPDDRLEMVRDLGYGGDIPPMLASYANQDLPKQYAIVKKNKESPVRIKVPNVPDITREQVSDQQLKDYIESLEVQPWYFSEKEIKDQINARQITPARPEEKILKLLSQEPRMTAKQIARLAYPTERTILINGKTYPSTYQSANNMLRRMADRKEVKIHELSKFGIPGMFMLPGAHRLKSSDKFLHEQAGADLFVRILSLYETLGARAVY